MTRPIVLALAACLAIMPAASGVGTEAPDKDAGPLTGLARADALAELGRALFHEPALSASGKQSCQSCHDPRFGFTPSNADPVQKGGPDGNTPGTRAVPTLKYLESVPFFSEHYYTEDEGDDSIDNGPTGGLTWDGRAGRGRDQARIPLLSANEMANTDEAEVARKALAAGYAKAIQSIDGAGAEKNPARVFETLTTALEAFQEDQATFYPYSSKFDAYLDHQVDLTPQERRGMLAFGDAERGNCANCHHDNRPQSGGHPEMTDFGLIVVGLPRNMAIPANHDPAYFDMGLCGPLRLDHAKNPEDCGAFKTPTLRNVGLKKSFFHNGVMHTLRDAVAFYAERDTQPEKWYPRDAAGKVVKFNDLPAAYRTNVNDEAPFGERPPGKPSLTPAEIDDIVAFLGTLTDGYRAPLHAGLPQK